MTKSSKQTPFVPFANESDVLTLANLTCENRVDCVMLMGDVELTKDKRGLELARHLQAVVNATVAALEAQRDLPDRVAVEAPVKVKNPLA